MPNQRAQLYAVDRADADAEAEGNVVEGTLLICGFDARVLFDSGSSHSFLSPSFAKLIDLHARELTFILIVPTPVGNEVVCRTFYPKCLIIIGELVLPADLI